MFGTTFIFRVIRPTRQWFRAQKLLRHNLTQNIQKVGENPNKIHTHTHSYQSPFIFINLIKIKELIKRISLVIDIKMGTKLFSKERGSNMTELHK